MSNLAGSFYERYAWLVAVNYWGGRNDSVWAWDGHKEGAD